MVTDKLAEALAELAYLRRREEAIIAACKPADGGQYVNDIVGAIERMVADAEAKGRSEERAAIVAFLRAEAAKFDKASHDKSLPEHSQERCSVRAALLETEIAYITRGDHERST